MNLDKINIRGILALFWSAVSAYFLYIIIMKYGHILAILTLVIGLVGGTVIGGIFGMYFGGTTTKNPIQNIEAAGDSIVNQGTENKDLI